MGKYKIKSLPQYFREYQKSVRNPEKFWAKIASNFEWDRHWDNVMESDWQKARFSWFSGARLNITINCIDRHLKKRAQTTAILFEPNDPNEPAQSISYRELHHEVCKMANVLVDNGIQKGDCVCIYLPMIPELAIAMLACARIGAVHSVIFAGFSSTAISARINDSESKMVITADGGYRGGKSFGLKQIVDEALESAPTVKTVLVAKRTGTETAMREGRDQWLQPLLDNANESHAAVITEAEDPLFLLYTSGSTGKPKGMVHTIAGYMVFSAYTFQNIFNYKKGDVYWCTADLGWVTGHTYGLYGPLLNGATTVMFEGIPTWPDFGRFWQIIEKHKVTQFYTAPTAIRALAKESVDWITKHDLSTLKIIGSVGEPINEEAWHWYNDNVGKRKCPLVDTWWQTETGGIMISAIPFVTPTKPAFATLPLPGIQPVLLNAKGKKVKGNPAEGILCIDFPWPGMARTIRNDHERYIKTYFSANPGKYTTGDGALRDETGYYRITGRVDDVVIVSGHNLGTAPIEEAINEHPEVAESAIVAFPHDIKGNALYAFVILRAGAEEAATDGLREQINNYISRHIGPIAKLDKIQFVNGLPKTRSGKIMRRILRKIAAGDIGDFGDITTLLDPEVVDEIKKGRI